MEAIRVNNQLDAPF